MAIEQGRICVCDRSECKHRWLPEGKGLPLPAGGWSPPASINDFLLNHFLFNVGNLG